MRKTQKNYYTIDFGDELPAAEYFPEKKISLSANDKSMKMIVKELGKLGLIQTINLWKNGVRDNDKFIPEETYTLCDERTKSWLDKSFESLKSSKIMPV